MENSEILDQEKNQKSLDESLENRSRVYVFNKTNLDPLGREDGNGRYLQVRWFGEQVHQKDHTELVPFNQRRHWSSEKIGNGRNQKTFNITISRELNGDIKDIMTFQHIVSNDVYSPGRDYLNVYKDFKADGSVEVIVRWELEGGQELARASKVVSRELWFG